MSRGSALLVAAGTWIGSVFSAPVWVTLVGVVLLVGGGLVGRERSAACHGVGSEQCPNIDWRRLTVAVLAMAFVGAGLCGARATMRDRGPLAARQGVPAARMEGVVVTEPRVGPFGSWMVVRVEQVGATRLRGRALLRAREPPPLGARLILRARVRPLPDGEFGTYLRALGAGSQLVTIGEPRVRASASLPLRLSTHVREHLRLAARHGLPADRAALLTGLVTGDARGRPAETDDLLRSAGLSHLVVVSGRHTALFLAGVMAALRVARCGFATTRLAALAALGWFVVLVRWQPSVLRAAAVATMVLLADLLGRDRESVHLLAMAVVLLLLVDPLLGGQLGFVLSVTATAGVLVVGPVVATRLGGPGWLRTAVGAALGAQMAVAPVLIAESQALPSAAVAANLIAAPAAGIAQIIGSVAAIVSLAWPEAATVVTSLAFVPLGVILWVARVAASAPSVGGLSAVPLLVGVSIAGGLAMTGRRRGAITLAALALAVSLLPPGLLPWGRAQGVTALTITVLDVGQGDAVLVEAPDGKGTARMLVDGGPGHGTVADELRTRQIRRLDAVVLTHAHHDHSGGLPAVLSRVDVGALLVGAQRLNAHRSTATLAAARGRGTPVIEVAAGDDFALGSARVEVLGPSPDVEKAEIADANDTSVVLSVTTQWGRVLLTGDAEGPGQRTLLRSLGDVPVDVVKVPHHGGATNTPGFFATVGADLAIISVGADNDYGHPARSVVDALAAAGTRLKRTDHSGTVTVSLGRDGARTVTER